jgi:hypothetical protein
MMEVMFSHGDAGQFCAPYVASYVFSRSNYHLSAEARQLPRKMRRFASVEIKQEQSNH